MSIVGLMVGLAFAIDGLKTHLARGKSRLLFGCDPGCPAAGKFLPVSEQEFFLPGIFGMFSMSRQKRLF